jgi:TRAP-type C4-dicarboxylate transport system substrate-binding protein
MARRFFSFRLVLGICMCVICLGLVGQAAAYDEKSPMVLKVAIDNPKQDMKSQTIYKLADLVGERTKGRVQFKFFHGASLIKKPQFVDGVARGIADISTGPISFVTGKIPDLSPFEVYGAYRLDKFLEMSKAVMPSLNELFGKHGIHPLFIQYSGSVVFAHKTKFLNTPADWSGQKMRLAGRWQSTLAKNWGASPVFMPPGDLYVALQRGVIDGYMLIWDIVYGLKLHEVAPYITDSGFSNNIEVVTMNLKKWEELTDEDKKIFNDAVEEILPWTYDATLKYYEQIKKNIIDQGGKIHKLSAEEKTMYLKDSHALLPEVRKVSGEMGGKFLDLLEPYRDQ